MCVSRKKRKQGLISVIGILSIFLVPVAAIAAQSPVVPRSMKYEIRKGQLAVGKARIDFNRPRRRNKRILQKVEIRASIDPIGNAALRVDVDSYSWIGRDLFPSKAKWQWTALGQERSVKAKYHGNSIHGLYQTRSRQVRTKTTRPNPVGDVVSLVAWLAGQTPKPGDILKTTTYTGLKLYDVTMEVGEPLVLDLPVGSRNVFPIKATAKRPGKTRQFNIWVDAKTGSLARVSFHADYIGAVDMVLVAERR